jgi:hypothetical protein
MERTGKLYMTKQEKIDKAVEEAKKAQIRDDVCARSVLIGLQSVYPEITDEMVKATLSLAGGTGSASGSCGAYCCGLLGVGTKYNPYLKDELENPDVQDIGCAKFIEYRDRFMKEMGTVLCPEIQKKMFGRGYILYDPKDQQEFLNLEGHGEKCAEVVGVATRIAAEMIFEDEE